MERVLEPEVMDTGQDAVEYDSMDFTEINQEFASRALELSPSRGKILDVGTGTARIPILILQQREGRNLSIHAIDLSREMLKLARRNAEAAGLTSLLTIELVDAKSLPFEAASYDMVISNSIVHHIPEPIGFFQEMTRVLKPGGGIFIKDLLRPVSMKEVDILVQTYAGNENPYQQKLFRDSLCAALSLKEMERLVDDAGLHDVRLFQSTDRHWSVERPASG